jgi:hypothetical protein
MSKNSASFGDLFDLAEGKRLRDRGIEQISNHNEPWIVLCQREAEHFISTRDSFTGEDIRFHCQFKVGLPRHPNGWGALINSLVKRKIIRANGQLFQSKNETSHARKAQVYTRI